VEEGVVVTGTRGCFKASGLKWCKVCSDPTAPDFTLGLEWQDVGAAAPAEGRRLANAKLQDALASKRAMFAGTVIQKWQKTSGPDGQPNSTNNAQGNYIAITAMPAYQHFSFEELREQDYDAGRKKAPADAKLQDALASKMAMLVVKEGCSVRATATFTPDGSGGAKEVPKDALGSVSKINEDGDANIDFEGVGEQWVKQRNFGNISVVLSCGSSVDRMQFAQEELDAFGFTDLRSTDFVEAGGRYFRPAASRAQILENAGLADALTRQTELTQREWDAFGVRGLRMSQLVKAGDAYYRPAGTEEQKDVRVLRSLAHYGAFRKDGRLAWDVGDEVAVGEADAVKVDGRIGKGAVVQAANDPSKQGVVEEDDGSSNPYKVRWEDGTKSGWLYPQDIAAVPLQKEVKGTVLEFNAEGAAKIDFGKGRKGIVTQWVPKDQFHRLYPLPSERDTPIQRQVKLGRLRRCDVTALVMYTGECSCGVRELTCTRACIL